MLAGMTEQIEIKATSLGNWLWNSFGMLPEYGADGSVLGWLLASGLNLLNGAPHDKAVKMETGSSSKPSGNFYQNIRRHVPGHVTL
jgi:hypothetical protein